MVCAGNAEVNPTSIRSELISLIPAHRVGFPALREIKLLLASPLASRTRMSVP